MEERAWTHPEIRGKDDHCPACGACGLSHITTFYEGKIGRECQCGARWPIDTTKAHIVPPTPCPECSEGIPD